MANDGASSGTGEQDPLGVLSEQDLVLGKRAVKIMAILCVVTFVACVGIAVFVLMNVPWNTRMPYEGRFDRSGKGIPMQIAMLVVLVALVGLWRAGTKPGAHYMGKGSRVGLYILEPAMIMACGVGQWVMGEAILTNGGYFSG